MNSSEFLNHIGLERGMTAVFVKSITTLWDSLTAFFLGCALMCGGLAIYGVVSGPQVILPELADSDRADAGSQKPVLPQETSAFDAYAPIFMDRDIFQTDVEKLMEQTAVLQEGAAPDAPWTSEFQLAGIMIDSKPRAIIKPMNSSDTQFLAVGDRLGEAVVQRIGENDVWFMYQGRQVQLSF